MAKDSAMPLSALPPPALSPELDARTARFTGWLRPEDDPLMPPAALSAGLALAGE
jgi:hypothetical protein